MEFYTQLIEFNWTLVFMWMTVLVLFLILKRHFFEKIRSFMQARENQIRETIEHADQINQEAVSKLEGYEQKIAELESEGREIVRKAKIKADDQAKAIVDEANEKAAAMLHKAEEEIEREKIKAIGELRAEIISLSLLAAEKILEHQLDKAGQEEMISDILEKAGRAEWQN